MSGVCWHRCQASTDMCKVVQTSVRAAHIGLRVAHIGVRAAQTGVLCTSTRTVQYPMDCCHYYTDLVIIIQT